MTDREDIPADVLQALETLERASVPTDLGRPYQKLLHWRRQRPMRVFASNAAMPVAVLALLGAMQIFLTSIDVPDTEFWRGVSFGLWTGALIFVIRDAIWPRPPPPQSISARIEAAIDRWRHAVPAMRELPR